MPTLKTMRLPDYLVSEASAVFSEWIFFFSFFFEAVFKEVGTVHCKSRTAWHAAQLSAMRVCRES